MLCCKQGNIYKKYTKIQIISKTNNSKIYIVKDNNNKQFILKKISCMNKSLINNEIKCLKCLQNNIHVNNFINYEYNYFKFYLILEYIHGKTLAQYLDNNPTENDIITIINKLVIIFKEIQKCNIIHRDIKLENIMIANNSLKVIDFGYSIIVKNIDTFMTNEPCGTLPYMCPEMIQYQFYSSSCDSWSLGVLFYVLLTKQFPYSITKSEMQMYQMFKTGFKDKIQTINLNNIVNEKMKQLIKQLLHYDRDERIKINKIII